MPHTKKSQTGPIRACLAFAADRERRVLIAA